MTARQLCYLKNQAQEGKTMFKKRYLGYFLIVGGTIIGGLATLLFFSTRGERVLLSITLVAAVLAVLIGSIILFTKILNQQVQKVIDDFDADVGEEIEDFLAGRRTNVQTMFIVSVLTALAFLFFVLKLHKLDATWGGLSVVLCGLVLSIIVAVIFMNTDWFKDQQLPTPLGAFFIPVVAIVLSMLLGLQTEDLRNLGFDLNEQVAFNTYQTTGFELFDVGGLPDISFDCNDDGCLVLMLIIALIVIALVLVAGSAAIPHFWVVSVMILLTIMLIITIHEFRTRRKQVILKADPGLAAGAMERYRAASAAAAASKQPVAANKNQPEFKRVKGG
jgi:hypothetical protein